MDEQRLTVLLKREEGPKLDFKLTLNLDTESDKKEFAKDICAIANSRGGRGYLIIGIADKNKEIVGINPKAIHEEQIQQIISYRCDPPIPVRVDVIPYQEKNIGLITIFKSQQRPHQTRHQGTFYIRRGSTTDIAHREEVAAMMQDVGLILPEAMPIHQATLAEIDSGKVNKLLNKFNISPEQAQSYHWESMGIIKHDPEIGKFIPTLGGILLFGQNPQKFLPHSVIKIVDRITYRNHKKGPKTSVKYVSGTLLEMLEKTETYLKQILKDHTYPFLPLRETLCNAIVHRDYLIYSHNITLLIQENMIEISNPGTILDETYLKNLDNEFNPPIRNPWLFQKLMTLDEKQRFVNSGLGLEKIKESFENKASIKFINDKNRNLFRVQLPGVKHYRIK